MEIMKTVCSEKKCNGCSLCHDICPKGAIDVVDGISFFNAYIDIAKCIDCGLCEKSCPVNNPPILGKQIICYQGWARDEEIRKNSSSGGVATAIAKAFVKNGGLVCSCVYKEGKFSFCFAETSKDVELFVGSKYVKSDPSGSYKKIKEYINSGEKVLFIGLPCQSAAVKKYIGNVVNLYTCDLICHGTPSNQLLKFYLSENRKELANIKKIRFRLKEKMYLSVNDVPIEHSDVLDRYTMAFLRGVDYTENCYSCHYAQLDRISDLTLGDSWGTQLPIEEQKKGISLILCQTENGKYLLETSDLILKDVDMKMAVANNRQLRKPSKIPNSREIFFDEFSKCNNFSKSIGKTFPKDCFKQKIKKAIFQLRFK